MDKERDIELLGRIKPVAAPSYLKTRIEGKLTARITERMPLSWALGLASVIAILFVLNLDRLNDVSSNAQADSNQIQEVYQSLGMSSSNQLYHD